MNKLQLAILIAAVVALIRGVRAFNNSADEYAQEMAFRQLAIECAIQPEEPRCDQAATAAGNPEAD